MRSVAELKLPIVDLLLFCEQIEKLEKNKKNALDIFFTTFSFPIFNMTCLPWLRLPCKQKQKNVFQPNWQTDPCHGWQTKQIFRYIIEVFCIPVDSFVNPSKFDIRFS